MAEETKNVFISHIHEDDAGLGKLKGLLRDNGMAVRDYSITADNPNNCTFRRLHQIRDSRFSYSTIEHVACLYLSRNQR